MTDEILARFHGDPQAVEQAYARFQPEDLLQMLTVMAASGKISNPTHVQKLTKQLFKNTFMSSRVPIASVAELASTPTDKLQLPRGARGTLFLTYIDTALIGLLSK